MLLFYPCSLFFSHGTALRKSLSFNVFRLDLDFQLSPKTQRVVILGLEKGWIDDGASDRLAINRLKEMSDLSVVFAIVESRDDQLCQPSVVALDC